MREVLEDRLYRFKKAPKHAVYGLLNRSGLRFFLALSAAAMATLRTRKLCKVSYAGEWIHRFPSCTLVEPRLTLWTPPQIEGMIADVFMYRYCLRNRDIVMDAGAGTGWETLYFSRRVGAGGRVIAIEAHPAVFRCLATMRAENRLANVTLIQAAVVDREGEVSLGDSSEHEGNSIVGEASGIRVPGTTLDRIFRSLGLLYIDFLKMNIEGAERLAIVGM